PDDRERLVEQAGRLGAFNDLVVRFGDHRRFPILFQWPGVGEEPRASLLRLGAVPPELHVVFTGPVTAEEENTGTHRHDPFSRMVPGTGDYLIHREMARNVTTHGRPGGGKCK